MKGRIRKLISGAVGLLLLACAASTASAQVTTTGTIEIVIQDQQGGRLPGVAVTASATDSVTTRTVVTDAQGVATVSQLRPSELYVVVATLSGFKDFRQENVRVSSGAVTTLRAQLVLSSVTEEVTVRGTEPPVVDVTRATTGQDITLQLTESLPTGRSFQSYLQLVPGVLPDSSISSGNPASRSGMNWKDVITNDNLGISADNAYYFEAINVTDPVTGTFGANLNTEIIQEQKVITGGIAAEYVGSPGLISTVVTKSGTNDLHGSMTYYFQNQNLVAESKHVASSQFTSHDTAFTIGGPLVRDQLWGFGSFRYLPVTRDVSAQDTGALLRKSKTTNKQGFAKVTWGPTQNDLASFMFLNDPFERDADTDPTVPNNRIRRREQGGSNYSGRYSRVVGSNWIFEGAFNFHDAAISDFAVDTTTRNTVSFQTGDIRTLADEQLGGFGQDAPETRPTKAFTLNTQYQTGIHRVKGGFEFVQHEDHRNLVYTGDGGQYTSISNRYLATGVSATSISSGPWSTRQFRTTTVSDFSGFINTINTLPNRAAFYAAFDTNRDGTISTSELGSSLMFNSTAGNPDGQINYYRIFMSALGPQDTKVRGYSLFAQDEVTLDRVTLNLGLRAEQYSHYATTGAKTYAFDWTLAPRLSAAYDLTGDGRQKLSAYWGRYFDPIRMDMTNFAGTATGATREEQIFALGQWVTYRTRGGPTTIDGFYSPTTKTPYTDELQFQHEADLGRNMSLSSTYYHRRTRDIFEDFDPQLYTVPAAYPGDTTAPDTLFLGWDYFGWGDAATRPAANFFLGTMPGGKRDFNGLEFSFRKRYSNNWQAMASYSYLDAKGNMVSDGNADFVGDVLFLDPRAPNMYGTLPGTIHHLFKMAGSYMTPVGLELGATWSANSGTTVNRTFLASSRRLPVEGDYQAFGGITSQNVHDEVGGWVAADAVGAVKNPSWNQFDLRLQYVLRLGGQTSAELSMDIFNLFNDQSATRLQDLAAGTGTNKYLDEIAWVSPRRAFFGARIRF
ncbi:MAG: carboxypeptidase regulatory-like domain-containing protein [Acidobacteria bacterium]|nr:carboxypeptidase regulatory-like domain-containing protein [Acidobacteriota bacterium]